MRIRTRNDLIKFIEDHPPSPGVSRALRHYNENLGGFWKLPVRQMGGWIVRVITPLTLTVHHVVVQPDDRTKLGYRIWLLLDPIPWQYYDGDSSKNSLYTGDLPALFKRKRDYAKAKKHRPNGTRQSTSIIDEPDRSDTSEGNDKQLGLQG